MTQLRDEFGFSECLDHWLATEERAQYDMFPRSDEAWHAAIDAVRAALARKEFWIAPMEADQKMLDSAYDRPNMSPLPTWNAMRDSYIGYYGQNFGLDP